MDPINISDYEPLARERMEPSAWDYYRSGSDDEVTLRETRAAYERIQLRPRMLVDVSTCDLTTTVLGTPVSMPILVAPTAYHRLANDEGECATARGAGAANTLMVVSTLAMRPVEDVAQAATGPLWFQLYVYRDRAVSESLARRAEAAGCRALVLTVDAPRLGRRERDIRNGFGLPPGLHPANFAGGYSDEPTLKPGESGLAAYVA
ncbi:MAG TPA: alpha-hydroxy acid oxidase, partial [Ktedonobacterales bacterium]|nr:alpha-hydroxy acid oxidase [Ktedonobacterales bacterium]